jgi:hypothetical protein
VSSGDMNKFRAGLPISFFFIRYPIFRYFNACIRYGLSDTFMKFLSDTLYSISILSLTSHNCSRTWCCCGGSETICFGSGSGSKNVSDPCGSESSSIPSDSYTKHCLGHQLRVSLHIDTNPFCWRCIILMEPELKRISAPTLPRMLTDIQPNI